MAKTKTSITPESRKNMPQRGKGKRTLLLDAIKSVTGDDEEAFYRKIVERAINPEDSASPALMKEILSRMYPASKPTMPLVRFEFPANGTPVEKVAALEMAIANEEIPSDVAKTMIEIMKMGLEIQQVTEFEDRIKAIEDRLKGEDANI